MLYNFPYIELAWHNAVVQYYLETFKTYKFDNFFLWRAREKKKKVLFLNLILFLKIYVLLYIEKKINFFFQKYEEGGVKTCSFYCFIFLARIHINISPTPKIVKVSSFTKHIPRYAFLHGKLLQKFLVKKIKKKKKKKNGALRAPFFLFFGM